MDIDFDEIKIYDFSGRMIYNKSAITSINDYIVDDIEIGTGLHFVVFTNIYGKMVVKKFTNIK